MGSRVPLPSLCDKTTAGVPQLLDDLQKLSEDQDSCDVVFLLGRDEERVYAHRIILAHRYERFIILFYLDYDILITKIIIAFLYLISEWIYANVLDNVQCSFRLYQLI